MGKASSGKKVARAARSGRGVARRSQRSLGFPMAIAAIVVVGTALVVVSRGDRAEATPPTLTDHWHAAIGYAICGEFQPPQPAFENREGLHTHGDGLAHIHPHSSSAAGANATLDKYLELADVELTDSRIELPNGVKRENGDKCGSQAGKLRVAVWDNSADETPLVRTDDFGDFRLKDGQLITISFDSGDDDDIDQPPSASRLAGVGTELAPTTTPAAPTTAATPTTTPGATTTPPVTSSVPATTTAP